MNADHLVWRHPYHAIGGTKIASVASHCVYACMSRNKPAVRGCRGLSITVGSVETI